MSRHHLGFLTPDGRLTAGTSSWRRLLFRKFEAPACDPLWCPCQCYEGPWDDVREGLDSFLENSKIFPTLKTRLSIHQGDAALAAIRTLAYYSRLRDDLLRAAPLN
jgi:hypothetical protein